MILWDTYEIYAGWTSSMVNALIMSLVVVDLIVGNSALHCYYFITSHRLSSFLCDMDDPFGIHSKVGLCVRYGPSQDWLMFGNACPRHRSYVSVLSKITMQGPGPLFIHNYIMIGDVLWGNCTVCPPSWFDPRWGTYIHWFFVWSAYSECFGGEFSALPTYFLACKPKRR